MTGLVKVLLAVAVIGISNIVRWIIGRPSQEQDFHFNLCLCIILGAWIIREGMWW